MTPDLRFCQRCGHALDLREVESRERPYCPDCGFVVFLDPKLAAVVLVRRDGDLVLVRRAIQPAIGRWSFPSGYVDRNEVVEDAARREVEEETGLDVRLDGFVGLYSSSDSPVVLAVFSAVITGGELQAGQEAQEVGTFALEELPPLPFPHDYQILADWNALIEGRSPRTSRPL